MVSPGRVNETMSAYALYWRVINPCEKNNLPARKCKKEIALITKKVFLNFSWQLFQIQVQSLCRADVLSGYCELCKMFQLFGFVRDVHLLKTNWWMNIQYCQGQTRQIERLFWMKSRSKRPVFSINLFFVRHFDLIINWNVVGQGQPFLSCKAYDLAFPSSVDQWFPKQWCT